MTAVPTRLVIMRRLSALLEAVEYVNEAGDTVSMADKVVRGRILLGDDIRPPLISILEAARPDPHSAFAGDQNDLRHDMWPILVQGIVEDDLLNPTDSAYWMCAAVEKQLNKIIATDGRTGDPLFPDYMDLGGLISSLEILPPVVRPPEDKPSKRAFFFLPLRLGISIGSDQPYTEV